MNHVDIPELDKKVKEEFSRRLEAFTKKEKELERVEFIYFNSKNKEDVSRAKERAFQLQKEISQDKTLYEIQEYSELSAPLLQKYHENLGKVKKVKFFGNRQNQRNSDTELLSEFILLAKNYVEVDDGHLRVSKCRTCSSPFANCIERGDEIICPNCGETSSAVEDACPYRDTQRSGGTAKAANVTKPQFLEVIEKFQAKKNTKIPESVLTLVKTELSKYGIPIEQAKKKHVYMVLVDNNMTDYYEELSLILWELNGTTPPDISKYQGKLSSCYDAYEKVYLQMIKEKERRKSLNAWYVLFKLLQHLGYTPNPDDFCFLKNTTKTKDCDEKFGRVSEILGWKFQYTI
ncbi:putative transcription factor A2-like protein [Insectomime virus]|nr:putative transcription factor A2-like protein [Insectomime virus]